MRIVLFCFAGLIAVSAVASAGGRDQYGAIQDGSWALQFRVANDFTLSYFSGTVVSLKHHVSPSVALRVGLSTSRRSEDLDASWSFPDTAVSEDRQRNDHRVGLSLDVLYYLRQMKPAKLYFGGGPFVDLSDRDDYRERDQESTVLSTGTFTAYGANARLGVEWFFVDYLSLHAEYGARVFWFTVEDKIVLTDKLEQHIHRRKSDGWTLQDGGVLFGLSVYF